ncbi:MAG TPA: xanthine dehydrogenase family protein subunit M [Egicoccus sp.]|nr:xanthine dehydrogenase family protein subunit M [Egicoccus sp.]HSK23284.1 xanthine dehydrogenase family protein subunit M [Egicoccus sp.]
MIPATFDYVRAESIDHAVATLAEHGDEAKLLAGGHSLLPLMKLRLAAPAVLVDLGRIGALRGVSETDDGLAIGAMTRHQDIIDDPLVREHCGVLAHVTEFVGDAQVRHRGTIGGALSHGDAAGDLPAVALALDATFVVQGPDTRREVAAADFFVDYLETAIGDNEVLTEIRVPKLDEGWRWRYEKFVRVSQAWAIVGALALVRRENGAIGEARVALTNMATVPVRARTTEQMLSGAGHEAIRSAAEVAAEDTSPTEDLNASAEYREHLARVLTRRALEAAAS